MYRIPNFVFCYLLACTSQMAHAARPFVTDDARLTRSGHCQLETWLRSYADSQEAWALPACNPQGNLEFTVGGGAFRQDDASASNSRDYVLQFKTLLQPMASQQWGIGLAAGKIMHPDINPGPNQFGNQYVYMPASYAFDNEVVLHVNVGVLRDNGRQRLKSTYGLGAELPLKTQLQGIVEVYGDDRQAPFFQLGVRYSLMPDRLQIDTTLGQQVQGNGDTRWWSLGLRYTP